MLKRHLQCAAFAAFAALQLPLAQAGKGGEAMYTVTVTNITAGQQFTPILLTTHRSSVALFRLGQPASAGLTTLAEEGNVGPLRAALDANANVTDTEAGATLTNGGATATFQISGSPSRDLLSVAAMLIPTNDAFFALNGVELPNQGSVRYFARAYDSGTERNSETCAAIPGPNFSECGGPGGGARIGGGEGYVHVHKGIIGVGQLDPANRTWQNPVAEIVITRIR
jgi:Spondin_N